MTPSQLIAALNALSCGDLDALAERLDEARDGCRALEQDELAAMLVEARDALLRGELKLFRKRVETVIARLGHLRPKQRAGSASESALVPRAPDAVRVLDRGR